MNVMLATGNAHKLKELQALLPGFALEMPDSFSCDENGSTYEENASIKAETLRAALLSEGKNMCVLADDSGLEVSALDGQPGLHTARFGGPSLTQKERNSLLVKTLGETLPKLPENKRTREGKFVSVLVFIDESGRKTIARGEVSGEIIEAEHGTNGFGYDPVFFLPEKGCTMAELSENEKNKISHRAASARALWEALNG